MILYWTLAKVNDIGEQYTVVPLYVKTKHKIFNSLTCGLNKNLGIYREQNNLTHQCMETEDIGLVVYAKLEQRPPFTYLIYHATWIKRVWAYTHQPTCNYPNIAFLSKPLKFPPIIFCYWNWCLFVSLCHGLLWVRGSNSYKTRVYIWVWCVIGPGIPSASL